MTKVCISFAGASGLLGFPEFPATAAQQLQAEFPHTTIVLARTPDERRAHLPDTDVLYSVRFGPEDLKLAKRLRWLLAQRHNQFLRFDIMPRFFRHIRRRVRGDQYICRAPNSSSILPTNLSDPSNARCRY